VTGCLAPGGTLQDLAVGETPLRGCGQNETTISPQRRRHYLRRGRSRLEGGSAGGTATVGGRSRLATIQLSCRNLFAFGTPPRVFWAAITATETDDIAPVQEDTTTG
jgi:hypothetical protein